MIAMKKTAQKDQHQDLSDIDLADISVKDREQMICILANGCSINAWCQGLLGRDTLYGPVADVMPCNRFQYLLSSIHFVNNLAASDEQKKDRLCKKRPWLDAFREKCHTLQLRKCIKGVHRVNVPSLSSD